MAEEIPLTGGNSADTVVRIGDTVRKPKTPFDRATTSLLSQFAADCLPGVPQPLGNDAGGRRILSWVPGSTDFPHGIWSGNRTLVSAGQKLRLIHDASTPLVGKPLNWAFSYPDPTRHEVICHNDFAPYNMTFAADGTVQGVIDFDLAGPGPRLRDLAYLAWWIVPLGVEDPDMAIAAQKDLSNGSRRITQLCNSYGTDASLQLLDTIKTVLTHMSDPQAASRMIGAAAAKRLAEDGHFDHWARAARHFDEICPQIAANLRL